jgi:hypothetical protein
VPEKKQLPKQSDPDQLVELTRRVALLEADVSGLRRQVQTFDYDLQDAVNGFYRRRQADRMREVRDQETPKKPFSWKEIERAALAKAAGLDSGSHRYPTEETPSETKEEKTE